MDFEFIAVLLVLVECTGTQYTLRAQQALCDLTCMYESGDEGFMHVPLIE